MTRRSGMNMRWVLGRFFEDELNELKDYIETVEAAFDNKFYEFGEEIERRTAGMSPNRKEQYIEMMADDAVRLADRFPSLVRKTTFIFLYGLFEHSLLNLCGHVKKYGRFDKEPIGGGPDKGITAAQKFLKNVGKIAFPDQSKEWNDIKQMAEIRHSLSHRMGKLESQEHRSSKGKGDSKSKKALGSLRALKSYIRRTNGLIEISGMDEIKLNTGYCQHAIEVIRKSFADILAAVPDELLSWTQEEEIDEVIRAVNQLRSKTG